MVTDERGTRIREVRGRLAREGPVWIRGAELDFEAVTLPERDCDLLRDLLIAEGVETVVEVGLAYGSSALAIGADSVVLSTRLRPRWPYKFFGGSLTSAWPTPGTPPRGLLSCLALVELAVRSGPAAGLSVEHRRVAVHRQHAEQVATRGT